MATDKRQTVAVDFDGVIHSYTSGWTGPTPFDVPFVGAIDFLRQLEVRGYVVCIHSCRAKTEEGRVGIKRWLKHYGWQPRDGWRESEDSTLWGKHPAFISYEKPWAILYVDDKGFRFEGDYEAVLTKAREVGEK